MTSGHLRRLCTRQNLLADFAMKRWALPDAPSGTVEAPGDPDDDEEYEADTNESTDPE